MASVTKDTTVGEVLKMDIGAVDTLIAIGMREFRFPEIQAKTVEQMCDFYNVYTWEIVERINDYLKTVTK